MMWRMDDGGVVDLFFHSPKENIRFYPSLYVNHNPVAILVNLVALQDNLIEDLFNPYISYRRLDSHEIF